MMKKIHYLFLFIVIFLVLVFFAREPLVTVYHAHQISKSPAQTNVIETKLITDGKGEFKDYFVEFTYLVDGKAHSFKSINTSQQNADSYMNDDKFKSVTYAKDNPDVGMLTYHYDLRQKEDPSQTIILVLGGCAVLALILTLFVALVVFIIKRISR